MERGTDAREKVKNSRNALKFIAGKETSEYFYGL